MRLDQEIGKKPATNSTWEYVSTKTLKDFSF